MTSIECVDPYAAWHLAECLRVAGYKVTTIVGAAAVELDLRVNEVIGVALIAVANGWATEAAVTGMINALDGGPDGAVVAPPSRKHWCPHQGLPGYDPNPTMVGPRDGAAYRRYAAYLDGWHTGWWWDDLDRMDAELRVEAQWRREADPR